MLKHNLIALCNLAPAYPLSKLISYHSCLQLHTRAIINPWQSHHYLHPTPSPFPSELFSLPAQQSLGHTSFLSGSLWSQPRVTSVKNSPNSSPTSNISFLIYSYPRTIDQVFEWNKKDSIPPSSFTLSSSKSQPPEESRCWHSEICIFWSRRNLVLHLLERA